MGKTGTIYMIENLVNGKVYVGQTVQKVDRRLHVHKIKLQKQYHNNPHLQRAFNKYGENSFKSSVIEKCSISEIDDRERYWIKFFETYTGVYNIESGGNDYRKISQTTKQLISKKSRKMWADKETREKILRNLKRGKDNWNSRAVICVTDNLVFDTITEAGEYYSIDMKVISQTLSGRNPYCKIKDRKLEFEYYEEGKNYKPKQHVHGLSRKVVCITTGEIFNSVTEASEKYNIPTTNISKVCQGQRKHAGKLPDETKLTWRYA